MNVQPASRVACLVALAAGIATAPLASAPSRAALLGVLALVLCVTRPRPRWLAQRLAPALLGLGALLVPLLFASGTAHVSGVLLRALGATSVAVSIASTVSLSELGPALSSLGAPRALANAIHMLLWQLEHVAGEGRRLVLARRLRGAERFGPEVLSQLLLRTTARAERVDLAMRLRGAGDGAARSSRRLGAGDLLLPLSCLLAVFVVHWLDRSAP